MGVEYLIKKHGVDRSNVYMIGDGETDAEVSINAKINHIGVLWGYRTEEQLKKAGATVFARSPEELEIIIG